MKKTCARSTEQNITPDEAYHSSRNHINTLPALSHSYSKFTRGIKNPLRLNQSPTPVPSNSVITFVMKSVYRTSLEKSELFPIFAWRMLNVFFWGCLNFQSFGGIWSGRLLQSQIQSDVTDRSTPRSESLMLMYTPRRSSSEDSSVLGLLGGDFGLLRGDTLAELWLLSLCASLRRRRYSSAEAEPQSGSCSWRGWVRSGLGLQHPLDPSSTQDSPRASSQLEIIAVVSRPPFAGSRVTLEALWGFALGHATHTR